MGVIGAEEADQFTGPQEDPGDVCSSLLMPNGNALKL